MPVTNRLRGMWSQAGGALAELFDQDRPFGRLALVQVLMIAGDTLVTISLAGSLFFSISPQAAKGKVLLYLLITFAPFAVVSPLLGPMIDRSRGARRAMVVLSALGRAAVAPFMARDLHSLLLFPEAFVILVLSKLYSVTKGALVPEMAEQEDAAIGVHLDPQAPDLSMPSEVPAAGAPVHRGYAEWNSRLTLLGTMAGFVASVPAIAVLKLAGAAGVLVLTALVFLAGAIAAFRLPTVRRIRRGPAAPATAPADPHLAALQPVAHPEVLLGLTANAVLRGIAGFLVFLIAFGLRRSHAPLWWYGIVLGATGVGALIGLTVMPRLRRVASEPHILVVAMVLVVVGAIFAALIDNLAAQATLALIIGIAGALGQPSFDAMTQRYVPVEVQGRAFARFATRQQLIWVLGALIPVILPLSLFQGDVIIAVVATVAGVGYVLSRLSLKGRAVPRSAQGDLGR